MSFINFTRGRIINAGTEGFAVGRGPKGQLVPVNSEDGGEFIIKPLNDSYKFYILVDGAQKVMTVCDSNDEPTLVLMKENKNLQQTFKVQKVDKDQGGSDLKVYITCELDGAEYYLWLDNKQIKLSPEKFGNSDTQIWIMKPC